MPNIKEVFYYLFHPCRNNDGDFYFWGYGGTGRHVGLRNRCRKACRFESYYPYHSSMAELVDATDLKSVVQ